MTEKTSGPPMIDGRYLVEGQLGKGGMGVVLRARDLGLEREVALKLIAPELAKDAGVAGRFRREAATLAAIRNEHVVQVYSFGPHAGSFFFAMEYVRGPTLEEMIHEHADHDELVPIHRALTILVQVASGLEAAHAAGIIHRDVKPSNIIIEEGSGRPVLVDFGLALRGGDGVGEIAGTPHFMAPEQTGLSMSKVVGPGADVYGLACTAFELLTGRTPFDDDGGLEAILARHVYADPPRLSSFRPELAPLDPIFARALAKQPELRHANAGALRAALEIAAAPWLEVKTAMREREDSGVFDPQASRVLIVDDDSDFRKFGSRAVQLAFFGAPVELRSAPSGDEALSSARRHVPDLMILDFDMPRFDGLMTLSALRALPGGTKTRVIVVSAKAGDEERWKFGVLGVGAFVKKPVDLTTLVKAIGEAVGEMTPARVGG